MVYTRMTVMDLAVTDLLDNHMSKGVHYITPLPLTAAAEVQQEQEADTLDEADRSPAAAACRLPRYYCPRRHREAVWLRLRVPHPLAKWRQVPHPLRGRLPPTVPPPTVRPLRRSQTCLVVTAPVLPLAGPAHKECHHHEPPLPLFIWPTHMLQQTGTPPCRLTRCHEGHRVNARYPQQPWRCQLTRQQCR